MMIVALKKPKSQSLLYMARVTCRDCGELLTKETMTKKETSKKGKVYYLNRCRSCIVDSEAILRRLKRENPMPPSGTPCVCCARIDRLYCDHDHATKEFRGWVCKNCNAGMGLLGDNEFGLRRALTYLEQARPKQRSRSPTVHKDGQPDQFGPVDVAFSRSDNK